MGDRFQVIVATHQDKAHLHSHFVVNSVSFKDGGKFNDCMAFYDRMRGASDRLRREHCLSVKRNPRPENAAPTTGGRLTTAVA